MARKHELHDVLRRYPRPTDELIEDYPCELGTGPDHQVEYWETVTRLHSGQTRGGSIDDLDVEDEVLWADCACGHQTHF